MASTGKYFSSLFFLMIAVHQLTSTSAIHPVVGPAISAGVSFLKDKALTVIGETDVTEQKLDGLIRDMEGKSFWCDKNYYKTLEDLARTIISAVKLENDLEIFRNYIRFIRNQYQVFQEVSSNLYPNSNYTDYDIQILTSKTSSFNQISGDLINKYSEILQEIVPSYEVRLIY